MEGKQAEVLVAESQCDAAAEIESSCFGRAKSNRSTTCRSRSVFVSYFGVGSFLVYLDYGQLGRKFLTFSGSLSSSRVH